MRFAVIQGASCEAAPGLSGECRVCGDATIAKCGKHRIWHWAHKRIRTCDQWWEPETQWHRDWKDHFPKEWQEAIHSASNGEKHIADVKTPGGVALEFQHSFLPEGERQQRELFYPRLIWVVDGKRRARDRAQFFASLRTALHDKPLVISARIDDSALVRDWKESRVPVYFDFGDGDPADPLRFELPTLWRLNPRGENGAAYLSPVAKSYLIDVYLNDLAFDQPFTEALNLLADSYRKHQALQHRVPTAFDLYRAPPRRARRL